MSDAPQTTNAKGSHRSDTSDEPRRARIPDVIILLATLVTAFATLGLAGSEFEKSRVMDHQIKLMTDSNQIQWASVHTLNRPYVLFEARNAFDNSSVIWDFVIQVTNLGKTPTMNLVYDGDRSFNPNDILGFFQKQDKEFNAMSINLAGSGSDFPPTTRCSLNSLGFRTIMEQNIPFYVYAWAKYQDVLGGDEHYETQFCRIFTRIFMDQKMQKIVGRDFHRCPTHNCIDKDCAASR
jgi:hypothetical protein